MPSNLYENIWLDPLTIVDHPHCGERLVDRRFCVMPSPHAYDIAITLFEERLKNDPWALRALMHEKATWEIFGIGSSGSGQSGGDPAAIMSFIEKVLSIWHWHSYELLDVVADDTRIFCRSRTDIEYLPTGQRFNTVGADFFRIEGGYIREVISYPDPDMIAVGTKADNSKNS